MDREQFAAAFKNPKLQGFVWPQPDDAGDLRVIKDVIEHGCHIVAVEKEVGHPQFAYSIGLYLNYQQPEVIILELSHSAAGRAINQVAAQLRKGEKFECGVSYSGLHDEVPLMFRELRMEDHTDELGFAIWFYCSRSSRLRFPVFQAMWPDRCGRFPSDSQCDPRVVAAQTFSKKAKTP